MTTNIFLNIYQQAENRLTYNFFALLELLNSKDIVEFLTDAKTSDRPITNIRTFYGGGETNPDGSFNIKLLDGSDSTVFYENKTKRRGLDIAQLMGHLKLCKENDLLLVTSPRKSDINIIRQISDKRVIFKTWQEISLFLKKNFQDNPIALQFVEYGKKSGEFDELGEIYIDDIKVYCEYLKIDFDRKIESIFKNFIHEMDLTKFGFNNLSFHYNDNWGRKGAEITIKNTINHSYGQFGAISLYYDTEDHGIIFKRNIPEIAFFLDVEPDHKALLQTDNDFRHLIEKLISEGFESNLDNELSPNQWRLLFYRQPISEFKILNVQEIISFTEKVFTKLLKNNANRHKYFGEFV